MLKYIEMSGAIKKIVDESEYIHYNANIETGYINCVEEKIYE